MHKYIATSAMGLHSGHGGETWSVEPNLNPYISYRISVLEKWTPMKRM